MTRFIIGEPVKKTNNPKNKYRLHVHSMHGDADHYTTQHHDFVNVKGNEPDWEIGLFDIVIMLTRFLALPHNTQCEVLNNLRQFVKTVTDDPKKQQHLLEMWGELVGRDVTCGGYSAFPQEFYLHYFDKHGVEFVVRIEE